MKKGWVFVLAISMVGTLQAQEKGESPKRGLVKPILPKTDKPDSTEASPMTKEQRRSAASSLILDKDSLGISVGGSSSTDASRGSYRGGGYNRDRDERSEVEVRVQIGDFHGPYRRGQSHYRRELLLAPGEYVDFGRNRIVCDIEDNYYSRPRAYECSAQVCTRYNGWSNACFFCDSDDYWTKSEVGSTIEVARDRLTDSVGCWRPSTLRCNLVD